MAVGALEKKFWDRVCEVLERPDLKASHWEVRRIAPEAAKRDVAAIFAAHSQDYWIARFAAEDCCVTPVLALEECLKDPQHEARAMVVRDGGTLQFAPPLKMSEYEFSIDRPAPAPGEHAGEILREAGYSVTEIENLRTAGVI